MIKINAKMPNAMIITVIDVRSLLPATFFHANERISRCVMK
jgi:hypothetical protein